MRVTDIHPHLDVIFDHLFEGVYAVDRDRRIVHWNRAAERLTGYSAEEVLGEPCGVKLGCHTDAQQHSLCSQACVLAKTMEDGEPREQVVFLRHKNGEPVATLVRTAPIRSDSGAIEGAIEVLSDHTAALQTLESTRRLEREAFLDPVTGLGNRRALDHRVRSTVAEGTPAAMLLIDIDCFKSINDGFGHGVGDQALGLVGQALIDNTRAEDTLGRWGGDEFMVLLPGADSEVLADVADRIRSVVELSLVERSDENVRITISVGGTLLLPTDDAQSWIARADERLYESKRLGRNRITVDPPEPKSSGFVLRRPGDRRSSGPPARPTPIPAPLPLRRARS